MAFFVKFCCGKPTDRKEKGNKGWRTFSLKELHAATNNFNYDNKLGEGGFGSVYWGQLWDGSQIAVKRLKVWSNNADLEFAIEVEILGRVRHKNLLSLRGYCAEGQERLIVYDYMPNLSLLSHLHGQHSEDCLLDWGRRMKIAIGSAEGIVYLHHHATPHIIHRDIKASNVLLDSDFQAQVADFGFAKLIPDGATHVTTRVKGTLGYLAPEYAMFGKASESCDVYSFGILLLELCSGRKPIEKISGRKKSGSSRGLSDPATSTDSLRLLLGSRLGGGSRDASNESGSLAGEKACMVSSTDNFENQIGSSRVCGNEVVEVETQVMEPSEISLRHWLDKLERTVDRLECLHIFRQIVEAVNLAHSESVVVHNVRPSCFIMSSFNRVSFIESASCSSPDSDSLGDGVDSRISEHKSSSPVADGLYQERIVTEVKDSLPEVSPAGVSQRTSEASSLGMGSGVVRQEQKVEEISNAGVEDRKKSFPLKQILDMELNWYTSPEEAAGDSSSFASDIYRLGVLLFELFCTFSSNEEKLSTMSNLRHRVLPPQLLLKWPKEASFCLWLLHPQPSTRPKMSEVLQSEFLNEPRDTLEERVAAIKLKEEIEEQELLLEFLLLMQQKRQEIADKLDGTICFLSSDIEEVLKQQSLLKRQGGSYPEQNNEDHSSLERVHNPLMNPVKNENSNSVGSRKRFRPGIRVNSEEQFSEPSPEGQRSESQESILSKSSRLMKNFKKLESAYFSTRCRLMKPSGKLSLRNSTVGSVGRGSVVRTEGSSVDNLASKEGQSEGRERGWVNPFLGGLCKYLSFSKLKVRADLKQGDLVSSNLVCSLGFDRDKEFFATAGVSRKIKIFECDAILNEARDIHYPVTEMVSRSKLSSISWNSYIKSQIASSDFEGVVQVWDVTRGQVYMEMREHERRVWSVDFSQADPTKLASGSDDGAVKLWNINQEGSVGTIRMKANVCCVQFPPDSARSLAVGSADHKIYCFDLRNMKVPWCTLIGHTRTVSYVKFVDSNTIVSASTDNSLKLWDLTMNTSQVLNSPVQTYTGHTNVKNFVGLSISDGYIATGSETNEVFVYQKSFPMPVLSFKFNSTDPLSGQEVDDSNQFVSCVCWRGQSSTLVAANSTGNIKLLEMV